MRQRGFTLIELLVVLTIIGVLLSIASPRYFASLERSKEVALRQDLSVMRGAIANFYSDTNRYPESLDELVQRKYLKAIPVDPITESSKTWQSVAPPNPKETGLYDVFSGAKGNTRDGQRFSDL